jgi:hypothetical protein
MSFYDEKEFEQIISLYGKMNHFQYDPNLNK